VDSGLCEVSMGLCCSAVRVARVCSGDYSKNLNINFRDPRQVLVYTVFCVLLGFALQCRGVCSEVLSGCAAVLWELQ